MNHQHLPATREMPPGRHEARRDHLLAELGGAPAGLRRRPLRLAIGGAATAALASGVAVALTLPSAPSPDPDPPVVHAENAARVLGLAARAAAAQPDLRPRADQYVYVETTVMQAATPVNQGAEAPARAEKTHRRVWLSADGRHAGLLITKGGSGPRRIWLCDGAQAEGPKREPSVDLRNPPQGCQGEPAYRPSLPTTPGAMRAWLYRNSHGGNPPDVQAFTTVGDTIRESYVPPAALSAVFAAAAKIPGTTVRRHVVDAAGRTGVAVGQTWGGRRRELIFDPKTYRLLGEREVVSHDESFRPRGGKPSPKSPVDDPASRLKDGTVLFSTAVLAIAVTDGVAQTPATR